MLLLTTVALAAPRVWVGAAVGGSVGVDDPIGGGGGAGVEAGVRLGEPRRSVALAARVRESVLTERLRTSGNIEVQVQWPSGDGPFGLVGFSHNHEALVGDWLDDPVGVTAGVADTIVHRTGFEVGGGWVLPAPYTETPFLARFQPLFLVTAHVFPDAGGPHVYGTAEVGLRIGVGGG